jgi:RNA polymerase sigma-70 factor (ECF subfamily)
MSTKESEVDEDIRILTAVAAGDRAAFRDLYARFSSPLYALAVRLLGDASDAEEALQDTFVKIARSAPHYDARKSRPFTWAVTILRRTCIDLIRKNRRAPLREPLPVDDDAHPAFALPETARQTAEMHDTAALVHAGLAHVAQPQRSALELALFSTLTQSEIATRLSLPVGTVKTWVRRGLLDLRKTLKASTP